MSIRLTARTLVFTVVSTALLFTHPALGDTVLLPAGSVWKYLDNGTDPGASWRASAFNDASWKSGTAELGYGDGDEKTIVSFGPDPANKYISTYFRRTFTVANPSIFTKLTVRLLRDDGAIVYLNGAEIMRSNMPPAPTDYHTLASGLIPDADEKVFFSATADSSLLVAGANVLAVEVHQGAVSSSDLSFDFELTGSTAGPAVTRGPYLQTGTTTGMVVRWRTDISSLGRVSYGTALGSLTFFRDETATTTEHELKLTGLTTDTRYYYSVGTTTQVLAGADSNTYFYTSPPVGSVKPTRVWVLGDSGTGDINEWVVRDAYYAYAGSTRTDLWLMLGDNAYASGLDTEYQDAVFDSFPTLLRKSVLWPSIGNHDTDQADNPPPNLPYFNNFTLPTNGEAGGVPSGTEKYYSFDYANTHFIALDAMSSDRSPGGPMVSWLKQDLAATRQRWLVAYWHHAPYSKGTHDSDNDFEMKEMRQYVVPVLEAGNVDLVLTGHSHVYERSFLIDGNYGLSSTLTPAMIKNGGDGRINGSGAYSKAGVAGHEGTVYLVLGVSSEVGEFMGTHPVMYRSEAQAGSVVLDVNDGQMDVKFLRDTGAVDDYFTIRKGVVAAIPVAPSNLMAQPGTGQIALSWTDNSNNEASFQVERATDGVSFSVLPAAPANATSYTDSGLSSSLTYTYRVASVNPGGRSAYSNLASGKPANGSSPTADSASPAFGSSPSQSFLFQFSDGDGGQDLGVVNVLINNALDGRHACYIAYSRPENVLYLVSDIGDGLLPGLTLNGSGSVSNSQCTVTGAGSSASTSGTTLTLTLNISFSSAFGGNKLLYLAARDSAGKNSGWQTLGVYGVPPASSTFPHAVSVSPASGTSSNSQLTYTYQDHSDANNLQTAWALINTALDGAGACYVAYYRPGNLLLLLPDNGDGSKATSMVLNAGSTSLSNSQCTILAARSSASVNGNKLTITLDTVFKPVFAGRKAVWLGAATVTGQIGNWQALGAWQVPAN